MNKKSFLWGVLIGIVVTIAALYVIELINQNYFDSVHYLEKRASYEKNQKHLSKYFRFLKMLHWQMKNLIGLVKML